MRRCTPADPTHYRACPSGRATRAGQRTASVGREDAHARPHLVAPTRRASPGPAAPLFFLPAPQPVDFKQDIGRCRGATPVTRLHLCNRRCNRNWPVISMGWGCGYAVTSFHGGRNAHAHAGARASRGYLCNQRNHVTISHLINHYNDLAVTSPVTSAAQPRNRGNRWSLSCCRRRGNRLKSLNNGVVNG